MSYILHQTGILVNKPNKDGEYVRFGLSKHAQWFYFGTKNFTSNLKVTFVIKNFYKKSSSYSKGMQPFVFSLRKYKEKGIAWHRACELICYSQNFDNASRYTLRFTYTYEYEDDIVYFAHFIPYTLTRLRCVLHKLKMYRKNQNKIKIYELCKTVSNLPCYALKISNCSIDEPQKSVFITCRVHPGESNCSFMLEGILNQILCSPDSKIKFTYVIVPVLNPDGVYYGKYRCNMIGSDLNRVWHSPSKYFHPTIYYTKELLKQIHQGEYKKKYSEFLRHFQDDTNESQIMSMIQKYSLSRDSFLRTKNDTSPSQENVMMFVDLHGHSINDNIFLYGNKSNSLEENEDIKDLPNLVNQDLLYKIKERTTRNKKNISACESCTQTKCQLHTFSTSEIRLFTIGGCKFCIEKSKENTGRVCVYREFGIKKCYTLESSYYRAVHEDAKLDNMK